MRDTVLANFLDPIAKACGAKVKKAQTQEIGWYKVNKRESFRRQADIVYFNFAKIIAASQKIGID